MAGGVGSGTSSGGRGPGGTGLVPGAGGAGTGIPKPGKSKQQPCFGLASFQNAWNTQTQTFSCALSRALTLTGYAAGGAGVLPGGGTLSNIFT